MDKVTETSGIKTEYKKLKNKALAELQKLFDVKYLPTLVLIKEGNAKIIDSPNKIHKLINENGKWT